MEQTSTEKRQPVSADGRLGFALAACLWVILTALVAFLHHYFTKGSMSNGSAVKMGATISEWLPHSALGYLLLTTVGIDVLIDMRGNTEYHSKAWTALVLIMISAVVLMSVEIFTDTYVLQLMILSLATCALGKYYSLREYKW